jgi:hypothetical protein
MIVFQPGQICSSATATPLGSPISPRCANSRLERWGLEEDTAAPNGIASAGKRIKVEPHDALALASISSQLAAAPFHPLPARPYLSSHRRANPSSNQTHKNSFIINQLSQELWQTRKAISTAQEHEARIQRELKEITGTTAVSHSETNEFYQEPGKSATNDRLACQVLNFIG